MNLSTLTAAERRRRFSFRSWPVFLFIFMTGLVIFSNRVGYAGESVIDPEKLALIELIEDRLATAYTISGMQEVPDFGTLDRIYPKWHGGEPAKARRLWTFHKYRSYKVFYLVHSVYMDQPDKAKVKGKKQVHAASKVKFLKLLPRVKRKITENLFIITCRRNSSGLWEIVQETETQKPD